MGLGPKPVIQRIPIGVASCLVESVGGLANDLFTLLRFSTLGLSDRVIGLRRCMGGRMLFLSMRSLAM